MTAADAVQVAARVPVQVEVAEVAQLAAVAVALFPAVAASQVVALL